MRILRWAIGFGGVVSFAALSVSAGAQVQSDGTPKLVDIFASRTGEDVVVHVVASGDISAFKTTRKLRAESYTLTLDIPAIAPVDSKYDVRTPFTRRFELWPMKLGTTLGSRLVLELENGATSVISTEGPNRLFIKISRESGRRLATTAPEVAPAAPPPPTEEDAPGSPRLERGGRATARPPSEARQKDDTRSELPHNGNGVPPATPEASPAPPEALPAPSGSTEPTPAVARGEGGPTPAGSAEEDPFLNLFPAPGGPIPPLPPVTAENTAKEGEAPELGLRLGRLAFYPVVDVSWIRGSNLLLASQAPLVDNAFLVRGRAQFQLTDTDQALKFSYEARYRSFQNFPLVSNLSHFADVKSGFAVTPRLYLDLDGHLVRGSFESEEIDPGRELVLNVDPFWRGASNAGLTMELSERLGVKLASHYNRVQFTDQARSFFSYQTVDTGASFLYHLSSLTTLFGEYVRTYTPDPAARPGAGFTGDSVYAGVNGEITPRLVGRVQGGYSRQAFVAAGSTGYRGLVAQASLTRQFTESTVLTLAGGRQNYLSAFANNAYYTSNNVQLDLIVPLERRLRLVAGGLVFDNNYPLVTGSVQRKDLVLAGRVGVVYTITPLSFLRVDYRHESRASNLDPYDYRNDSLLVLVGVGFLIN